MRRLASRAGRRSAAQPEARLGLAAVLLACACSCSRSPPPPAGAAREGGTSGSPTITTAGGHLARGEEALERRDYPQAKEDLEKALALLERDQDWEGYVRAKNLMGAVANRRGDYETALEHLNAALATAKVRLAPSHREMAHSYQEIGRVYISTGRSAEALELLEKALALQRAAGGDPAEDIPETLLWMAFAHTSQGEDDRALALLDEAEALQRKAQSRVQPPLSDILMVRGSAFWGQGKYDPSIAAFEQAIAMMKSEGGDNARSLSAAYLNLANAYWSKSDYDEARAFHEKALPLQRAALGEAHPDVGTAHLNLAVIDLTRGDHVACIASAERALKILVPALGEPNDQVVQTYNVMGLAYTRKGDPDRGLALLEKALALQLSLPEKGSRDAGIAYNSLAEAYRAKGDLTRALRYGRQALAVDVAIYGERHPDVAEDFVDLGELYLQRRDEDQALRSFAQAIAANDSGPAKADPDLDPPFDTVFSERYLLKALKGAARARVERGSKPGRARDRDFEQASLVYAHASRLLDRMRAGYRAEGSKFLLAASATEVYDEALQNELELRRLSGKELYVENAFRYAEKNKAGVLRDALNEAEARSFAGIPGALLEKERQLRIDLAAADRSLTEAQLDKSAEGGHLQDLREKQFTLKRDYDALQRQFEQGYPDYYDLKYRFGTVGPTEVREEALDEGTVLVEYFLGREQVFIFTITRRDLEVARVAREASLEAELEELRRAISAQDFGSYARSAHRLYRVLLAPVEGRIAGKDLVIVPEGPLSIVPFEALLAVEVSPDSDPRELPYVLRDHAVSYAYSATVLLQGLRRQRERPTDALLAIAPGFAEGGPRLADAPRPLPASRKEVTDVRGLFRKQQGFFSGWLRERSRVYLGRDATEGRLKSEGLERYRYVHLATHGIVDEDHPGLSRLLLMPEGPSGEDGVLHLGEIYNLRLNADLVVLSACDTGRGRIVRGEGIIGLTRGFLYAGAQSLLVSLWPVSDAAASDLMVDFYAELLGGRPKAQALRAAKLRAIGRNPEYAKPYYWSSLVLVGQRR